MLPMVTIVVRESAEKGGGFCFQDLMKRTMRRLHHSPILQYAFTNNNVHHS